jgi:hypothetical protein
VTLDELPWQKASTLLEESPNSIDDDWEGALLRGEVYKLSGSIAIWRSRRNGDYSIHGWPITDRWGASNLDALTAQCLVHQILAELEKTP